MKEFGSQMRIPTDVPGEYVERMKKSLVAETLAKALSPYAETGQPFSGRIKVLNEIVRDDAYPFHSLSVRFFVEDVETVKVRLSEITELVPPTLALLPNRASRVRYLLGKLWDVVITGRW